MFNPLVSNLVTVVTPKNWELPVNRVGSTGHIVEEVDSDYFIVQFEDGHKEGYWNEELICVDHLASSAAAA